MKIVNIIGGLGNQMFQYAFAIALKKRFPEEEVLIDTSHFNHYKLHNGFELDKIFDISLNIANKQQLEKVTRTIKNYKLSRVIRKLMPVCKTEFIEIQDYVYDNTVFNVEENCYYEGYWQTWKYFADCKDIIRQEFYIKQDLDEYNKSLVNIMISHNSVTIHIRRGDYVNSKNFYNICTLEYYIKAIDYVKNNIDNPQFYIFSNDIEWCQNNVDSLVEGFPVNYINNNQGCNSYIDMYLMSKARCCIVANSSFSWWGAWLNNRPNHVIISPKKWINSHDSKDIYPDNWILF